MSLLITNALEHARLRHPRRAVRESARGALPRSTACCTTSNRRPSACAAAVISRIKIMASLDIAERRLPQDGRIRLRVQGKEIDLRVSTVPTMHGESVVMRILDKGGVALDFRKLGFADDTLEGLHRRADAAARHPARHRARPARARRRRSTRRSTG